MARKSGGSHGINKVPNMPEDKLFPLSATSRNNHVPKAIEDRPSSHRQIAPANSSMRWDESATPTLKTGNLKYAQGIEDYV